MATKRGYCPNCGKLLPRNNHAAWKRRDPKGWEEARLAGEQWCEPCDVAYMAAEAMSLHAAESGLGLERLRDAEYERDYEGL